MSDYIGKIKRTARAIKIKHGTKILVGAGLASGVAALIFTVKGSFKATEIIDNHNAYREKIDEELPEDKYTDEDRKKAVRKLYLHTGLELGKAYSPAIGFALASGALVLKGFGDEHKAHLGAVSAFNGVNAAFRSYRKAIAEKLGNEAENDLYNGIRHEDVVNQDTGEVEKVNVFDPNEYNRYVRFFDEFNPNWQKDPYYNLTWLKLQQSLWSDKLQRDKVVFLNDVYKSLGYDPIPEGQSVGWAVEKGDEFIDFGLYDGKKEKVRDFVNGYEPSILLTFPNLTGESVIQYI